MATDTAATRFVSTIVGAKSPAQRRQALWGYVFLSPWILGLVLFLIGPISTI